MADGKKISELTLITELAANDFIAIARGSANNRYDIHQLEELILNKRFKIFDTIAERDAYVTGTEAFLCVVVDASADPDVDSGGALYAWKPDAGVSGEYRLLAKYGELDMAVLIAAAIDGVAGKATLADADKIGIVDSADGNTLKKQTWAERKTQLEGLYAGTATPQDHGTAAVGNSDKYARENHVHNSDNTDTIYEHPATHPQSIIDESATVEGTPIDASRFHFWDTVNSVWKVITWTNIKAELKTYFESVWDFGHNIFSQLGTTALTQRAKLRFKGFLKATDETTDEETVVEIDETKTEAIEFVQKFGLDIDANQTLDSGNTTTLTDTTSADTTKTWGVNAYADKYCVIEYTNESFYPLLKECIKIASNTATELTFTGDRKYKAYTSVSAYEILDPLTFEGDEEPTIAAFPMTRNSVVELPALAADNNRIDCRIYNEYQTWIADNKRTFVFAKGTDTIFGVNHIELVDTRESVILSQHFTAAPHWDVLIDERFEAACVKLDTAEYTMTGDGNFNPVRGTDWEFGKFKGVTASIDDQTTYEIIELHAINAIPQDVKITALLQVLLKATGVEYEIQLAKFVGASWVSISPVAKAETTAALREITLSTQAADTMTAGDKYRLEVKVTNTQDFDVNDCSIIISEK